MRMERIDMDTQTDSAEIAPAMKINARNVDVFYDDMQAIHDVSVDIPDRMVTACISS